MGAQIDRLLCVAGQVGPYVACHHASMYVSAVGHAVHIYTWYMEINAAADVDDFVLRQDRSLSVCVWGAADAYEWRRTAVVTRIPNTLCSNPALSIKH